MCLFKNDISREVPGGMSKKEQDKGEKLDSLGAKESLQYIHLLPHIL